MSYYQTQFDSPEGLNAVVCAIENFSADRFFSVLSQKKNVRVEDITKLNAQILDATAKLQFEYANLQHFATTFNKQFVTRNNQFFETATILLRKLKSSAARFKDIFRRFTPNSSAAVPSQIADKTPRLIYENSPLSSTEYTPALFHDAYIPEVQILYQNMTTFFNLMDEAIIFCQDVINEEEIIRQDEQLCTALFHDFKDSHHRHIKSVVKCINQLSDEFTAFNNSAISLREHTHSDEEFSQKGFHKLPFQEVCDLLTKEIYEEMQRGEYSKEELFLFPDYKPHILRVRSIISHFDSFLPEGFSHKKIPATMVAALLLWADPKEDLAFVKYFKETYKNNGGQFDTPNNAIVNIQKGKLDKHGAYYLNLCELWNKIG